MFDSVDGQPFIGTSMLCHDIDNLIVKEAYCGKQIVMKRFRPRAKGRASPIIKPYSNLTIILAEKQKEKMEKR